MQQTRRCIWKPFDIPLKSLITFYHIQPTRQTVAAAELQAWEDNKRS